MFIFYVSVCGQYVLFEFKHYGHAPGHPLYGSPLCSLFCFRLSWFPVVLKLALWVCSDATHIAFCLFAFIFVLCCPPPFRRKAEGHCFRLSVVRGAWRVARGAWCVARGAWFRIFSRYLVPLTPPTVFVRSF